MESVKEQTGTQVGETVEGDAKTFYGEDHGFVYVCVFSSCRAHLVVGV